MQDDRRGRAAQPVGTTTVNLKSPGEDRGFRRRSHLSEGYCSKPGPCGATKNNNIGNCLLGYLVWATARRFISLGQASLAQPLGVEGDVLRTLQGH
jgi:hypothetical protein